MRTLSSAFILFALLLMPAAAFAVHPLQVEETDTQGTGNYLFELNSDFIKDNSLHTTKATGVITAGTGDATDLSLEVPYLLLDPSAMTGKYEQGGGDVRFKMKYRTYEDEVHQTRGFQLYTDIPFGNDQKGLGTNNVVWGLALMDQQECHGNILRVSAGYESYGRDTKQWHYAENYAVKAGFDFERRITDSFKIINELFGESRKSFDGAADTFVRTGPITFLTGFKYDVSSSWYIDLALRAGLNKYAEDYAGLAGAAWRF